MSFDIADKKQNIEGVLFSIIIPVYNVKQYLEECVSSVLNQDFDNFEVILVDDGSTDESGKICDELSNKYNRVFSFHKDNGGLSSARNFGVLKASGQYIYFLDGDDFIRQGALTEFSFFVDKYKCPEVICECGMYRYGDGVISLKKFYDGGERFGIKNGESALREFSWGASIHSACGKCYLLSAWKENKWLFTDKITSEDLDLIYKIVYESKSVVMTDNAYYVYREAREGSITYSSSPQKIRDYLDIFDRWETYLNENVSDKIICNGIHHLLGNVFAEYVLPNLNKIECDKALLNDIKKHFGYLRYSDAFRISYIEKILGFSITVRFFKVFMWIDIHYRDRILPVKQKIGIGI